MGRRAKYVSEDGIDNAWRALYSAVVSDNFMTEALPGKCLRSYDMVDSAAGEARHGADRDDK